MKSRKRLAGFGAMAAGAVLAGVAWTAEPENTGMPAAPAVPDLSKLIKPQDMEAMQRAFGAPAGGVQAAANLARRRADVATIRQLLPKERNLSIEDREGRIFIDGKVTTDRTRERVTKLTTIYDNVVDLTEFQPDEDSMLAEVDLIKEKIERTLNRDYDPARAFALPQSVAIEVVNDKLVLSGELNNADDIKQAYWIAKVYNEQIVNVLKVRRQMIEITAVFAKVVEKNQGTFGSRGMQSAIFTLPSLVAAPGSGNSPADVFSSGTWTGTTASGGFNYKGTTEADNILKMDASIFGEKSAILARPHLAVINGEKGEFLAGGEKAILNATANATETTYKKYGVILHTTPLLTTDGLIRVAVELEFSIPAAGSNDFITFIHKGEAVLSREQGMALSGLINEARSRDIDRTPGASQVPILNFFFGQKSTAKDGEELVLLVMPRLPKDMTNLPVATSDRTREAAEKAFWIHEPGKREQRRARAEGRGEYWVEGDIECKASPTEAALAAQALNASHPGQPPVATPAAAPAPAAQPAMSPTPVPNPAPAEPAPAPEAAPAPAAKEPTTGAAPTDEAGGRLESAEIMVETTIDLAGTR